MQEENKGFVCRPEPYEKTFFYADLEAVEISLKNQAIKDGFELVKDTGDKQNSIYYRCSRGGKPRAPQGTGKRAKVSKKIGNKYLCPSDFFRLYV